MLYNHLKPLNLFYNVHVFICFFCRKQASLWIQGDIFRTREKEKAEKGLLTDSVYINFGTILLIIPQTDQLNIFVTKVSINFCFVKSSGSLWSESAY